MSPNSRLSELQHLPTTTEYLGAFDIVEDSFGPAGAWGDVAARRFAVQNDQELSHQYNQAIFMGRRILTSDLTKDDLQDDDIDSRLVAEAYAQGFYQQLEPSQLLYSDEFTFDKAVRLLQVSFEGKVSGSGEDSTDQHKGHAGEFVRKFAEMGLSRAGQEAIDFLDRWASEVYMLESRLHRAFVLGHGAMITSALYFQETKNDYIIRKWLEHVDLDQEIETFITSKEDTDDEQ